MARKNIVQFQMVTDADASSTIISKETTVKTLDKASIHVTWTGAPVGVLTLEFSQEPAESGVSLEWFTLDFGNTINIDSSDTEHQIILNELPFDRIRLKYTPTSGAGVLNAKISAKQVGG